MIDEHVTQAARLEERVEHDGAGGGPHDVAVPAQNDSVVQRIPLEVSDRPYGVEPAGPGRTVSGGDACLLLSGNRPPRPRVGRLLLDVALDAPGRHPVAGQSLGAEPP